MPWVQGIPDKLAGIVGTTAMMSNMSCGGRNPIEVRLLQTPCPRFCCCWETTARGSPSQTAKTWAGGQRLLTPWLWRSELIIDYLRETQIWLRQSPISGQKEACDVRRLYSSGLNKRPPDPPPRGWVGTVDPGHNESVYWRRANTAGDTSL